MKDYPTPKKKKKKKKVLDHYLHHDLGMLPLLRCFFAHLLILQYPDHRQNLISSSLYYSGPVHKISSQSVNNVLSNVVHRQTNKQTNRQTDKLAKATKNITSFAKEVIMEGSEVIKQNLIKFWWWSWSSSMSKVAEYLIVVACYDWGAGNDPEIFGLAFHHQGLVFINAYCHTST